MLNAVEALAVEQHVDQLDRAAGGVQRRPIRTLARDRVGVEVSAARDAIRSIASTYSRGCTAVRSAWSTADDSTRS